MLIKSTLGIPFVGYKPVQIEYKGLFLSGCVSGDFLKEDEILIPIEKLHRQYTGESLASRLTDFEETSKKIQYLVEKVENITHIPLALCLIRDFVCLQIQIWIIR